MTVPSETNRSGPYNGNGVTTVFDYEFRIVDQSYLKAIKADAAGVETILTLGTDYSVTGVGAPGGGQVVLTVALPTGKTLTLLPHVPFTQEIDLENQGAYYAETVETGLDLAVMRDQQLQEQINRSVTIPASEDPSQLDGLVHDILRLADSADNIDTVANNIASVNNASANMAAIIAAPAQAAAAAASAGASAGSATAAAGSATAASGSATAAAGSAAAAASSAASINLPAVVANTMLISRGDASGYDAKSFADVRDALDTAPYVATRAAMAALNQAKDTTAILTETGREGVFKWSGANLSALVTLDAAQALYVPPASDATGASGAWVRVRADLRCNITWAGGVAGADSTTAVNAILAMKAIAFLYIPYGDFQCASTITVDGAGTVHIEGEGANKSRLVWTAAVNGLSLGQTTPIDKFICRGVGLITLAADNSKTAVNATFSSTSEELDVIFENNQVSGGTFTTQYWGQGVHIRNAALTVINNNFIVGRSNGTETQIGTSFEGILVDCNKLSVIHYIERNTILWFKYGIRMNSEASGGEEGSYIRKNNCTHCWYGIQVTSDFVSSYLVVQIVIVNNSVEFYKKGIVGTNIGDGWINDNWCIATGQAGAVSGTHGIHVSNMQRGFIQRNTIDDGTGTNHTLLNGVEVTNGGNVIARDNIGKTPNYVVVFAGTTGTSQESGTIQRGTGGRFTDVSASGTNNPRPEINLVSATYTANADLTTVIPEDDTIPQNTEGTQIITVTITPKSAQSKVLVEFTAFGSLAALGYMVAALFRDSVAGALQATAVIMPAANYYQPLTMRFVDAPGTSSAVTYKIRVGPGAAGTMRLNGASAGRRFGGAASAVLTAQEVNA